MVSQPKQPPQAVAARPPSVECTCHRNGDREKALRVSAFLMSTTATDQHLSAERGPLPTITTKTAWHGHVVIQGNPYVISTSLPMLQPPELYGCQGFPSNLHSPPTPTDGPHIQQIPPRSNGTATASAPTPWQRYCE